jgi:hypothetical protein
MSTVKMEDTVREFLKKANLAENWIGSVGGISTEEASEIANDPAVEELVGRLPAVTAWTEQVVQKIADDYEVTVRQVRISPDADMAFHVVFLVERSDYLGPDLVHAKFAVDALRSRVEGAEIRYRFDVYDQATQAGYVGVQHNASATNALQRLVISRNM